MKRPFESIGVDVFRLAEPYWGWQREDVNEPTMRQLSAWVNLGKFAVMLYIRWENYEENRYGSLR